MNFRDSNFISHREVTLACPQCDSSNIETTAHDDTFEISNAGESHLISAVVPFRHCASCGFTYTDHAAEKARHDAVCWHFGLLTPDEILRIRESYGLSRDQFAAITKIGTATLGRWERGVVLQNPANDQYLRLLAHRRVFELLGVPHGTPAQPLRPVVAAAGRPSSAAFRCVRADDVGMQRDAQNFSLRLPA